MPRKGPRSKTAPSTLDSLERQQRAVDLRRQGMDFRSIADAIGVTKSQAHRLVIAALEESREHIQGDAGLLRAEEVERLDAMLSAVWPKASRGELGAVDRVIRIGERRAKLLGLDAPTKIAETDPDGNPAGPRVVELVAPASASATPEPGDDSPA